MPMRVIAKKRCRAMVEPPEKGERAILNPNLSTRLKPTFFRSGPWAAGWLLLVEEGERRCLAVLRGSKTDRGWLYPLGKLATQAQQTAPSRYAVECSQ
jgi:hypothetical protein